MALKITLIILIIIIIIAINNNRVESKKITYDGRRVKYDHVNKIPNNQLMAIAPVKYDARKYSENELTISHPVKYDYRKYPESEMMMVAPPSYKYKKYQESPTTALVKKVDRPYTSVWVHPKSKNGQIKSKRTAYNNMIYDDYQPNTKKGEVEFYDHAQNTPRLSKNYPYREKRPFEIPQIECPPDHDGAERFACPTPDKRGMYLCIDDHVMCDGYFDCPNKEDEDARSCLFYRSTKFHMDVLADALLRWARG